MAKITNQDIKQITNAKNWDEAYENYLLIAEKLWESRQQLILKHDEKFHELRIKNTQKYAKTDKTVFDVIRHNKALVKLNMEQDNFVQKYVSEHEIDPMFIKAQKAIEAWTVDPEWIKNKIEGV